MRILYKGKNADKIFDILMEKGWKVEAEEEVFSIRVYDKEEYKELLADYKEAKKKVKINRQWKHRQA